MTGGGHATGTRRAALLLACAAACTGGCVERRMIITSEPEGALVSLNDVEVGATPCEVDFTYFGVYDVRLRKPGYEPLITQAEAEAPIHEWPLFDLAAMVIPARKRTIVKWHFVLEESITDAGSLVERASELRRELSTPDPADASASQ